MKIKGEAGRSIRAERTSVAVESVVLVAVGGSRGRSLGSRRLGSHSRLIAVGGGIVVGGSYCGGHDDDVRVVEIKVLEKDQL